MKIQWLKSAQIEIVEDYDEELDTPIITFVHTLEGQIEEIEKIGDNGTEEKEDYLMDIQFGDGSYAYGVPTSLFQIISE